MERPEYTAGEFREAVLKAVSGARPRTAVFDCDGTLWAPDSGFGFMRWTLEQGTFPFLPGRREWIEERYRLYEAGVVDEAAICGEMVQVYAGIPVMVLRSAAQSYFETRVEPFIYAELAALVAALRETGTELWAVSSTNRWVVQAGVSGRFGISASRVLAAEVAVERGVATDRLLAVPTDGAKREALIAAGVTHPDLVFGNSIHDEAMLAMARQPFAVNPSEALRAISAERGWRVFQPSDTGWPGEAAGAPLP